ncbi:MAG: UDP-N-acetylmuramate dehydrogenase [Oscillospiraceae bacterium]|jgi:UDP-N-acetylmuramate dehydrogenase|nr:UDP-N-acetylmuramate dehydrogenase [Oscillospiraceae bacterium]
MDAIVAEIKKLYGATILENEPMNAHTTFKIGGPIRALVYPNTFETLEKLLSLLYRRNITPLILGNGSNILAADEPIERIAVCTRPDGSGYSPYIELVGENVITASSGAMLSQLAVFAANNGLTGLEWAAGIPGTLGGAIKMNAGAYGGEMKQVVEIVTVIENGSPREYKNPEMDFSYRRSRISETDGNLVSLASLRLAPGDPDKIKAKMKRFARQRKEKQPLDLPSAGSAFKRPKDGYAAELIDKAGLKGYTVGGARISDKHAGFIVNLGGAVCRDVLAVMEHVQAEVTRQFGVELEPEVKIVR